MSKAAVEETASLTARARRDPALRRSLEYCHQLTRRRARNFYYGMMLTPEPKRSAMYTIYAFMAHCDDLADEVRDAGGGALERLERYRAQMQAQFEGGAGVGELNPEIWPAFAAVVKSFPIEPAHLHAMLDGQRDDLVKHRYGDFSELYAYCYKVASVVGLVCMSVWGHDGHPEVAMLAERRGIAFQLTNILRDLLEDSRRDRVYLPADELARFGYGEDDLREGRANGAFDELMRFQIDRARSYYDGAAGLDGHLDSACRPTSWVLTRTYRALLDRIAVEPRRVLRERVRLGRLSKLVIVARGLARHYLRFTAS